MDLVKIIKMSRPRFWLYLAGPFLLGYIIATKNISSLWSTEFIIGFLFFLIPANIFLYGINDYFDYETDKHNPKKRDKETLIQPEERGTLALILISMLILSVIYAVMLRNHNAIILMIVFLFLSHSYSAPPLRFKDKPIIDSLSNALYFLPGIIAYTNITNTYPPVLLIIGFVCWTAAMHLFSAIPDIQYDKKAKMKTTAIVLGQTASLIITGVLWLVFVYAVRTYWDYYSLVLIIYPLIPLCTLMFNWNTEKVYWYYPYVTAALGAIAFFYIALT